MLAAPANLAPTQLPAFAGEAAARARTAAGLTTISVQPRGR